MVDRDVLDRPARRVRLIDRTPDRAAERADPPLAGIVPAVGDAAAPIAIILGPVDRTALAAALAERGDYYVEWTQAAETAAALTRAAAPLVVSLTTRTAHHSLNGRMIAEALAARGVVAPALAAHVAGAVQEALANAIIHGNLGLRMAADGDAAFERLHEAIAERLAGAEALRRRVTIGVSWTASDLRIAVSDEGDGFAPPPGDAVASGRAASGRGLMVMRNLATNVAFADGGRSTVLTFARLP